MIHYQYKNRLNIKISSHANIITIMFEKFLLKILSYSFLLLGFYLLYIAFLKSNLWPGIVGGVLIIAAMVLLTKQKQGN